MEKSTPQSPLAACAATIGVIWLGFWLSLFLVPGPSAISAPWFDKLLIWDSGWYRSIAQDGYAWNPDLHHGGLLQQQNIAFFPLYPMLERALHAMGVAFSNAAMALPSAIGGILSVVLFSRLAGLLQAPSEARRSTLAYAVYPGIAFFVLGYPTSIINVLAIGSLILAVRGRWFGAAVAIGIATAAGPLAVFMAAVIPPAFLVGAFRRGGGPMTPPLRLAYAAILSVTALSGLALFMLYQAWRFGNPVAFVAAQAGWGNSSLAQKLLGFVTLRGILGGAYGDFFRSLLLAAPSLSSTGSLSRTVTQFELFLNGLTGIAMVVAYGFLLRRFRAAGWPDRSLVVLVAGISVFLGCQWFHGAAYGPESANRLLFLSFPAFLAVGAVSATHPRLAATIIAVEAVFAVLQVGFLVGGYYVI